MKASSSQGKPKIAAFPEDNQIWRLNWFGEIQFNVNAASDPLLEVILEQMQPTFDPSSLGSVDEPIKGTGRFKSAHIGIGTLPSLAIGTFWKNGRMLHTPQNAYSFQKYKRLEFGKRHMRLVKAGAIISEEDQESYLIPPYIHRIQMKNGLNTWCLAIEHDGDPFHLIIPAMEVIRFYYCASTLSAQILLTTDYPSFMDMLMDMDKSRIVDEDTCIVSLRPGILDCDTRLCAALLQSKFARRATALLYQSIQASAQAGGLTTPKAYPPFLGIGRLSVRGIRYKTLGKIDSWFIASPQDHSHCQYQEFIELTALTENQVLIK